MFLLSQKNNHFPDVNLADEDGLLAVGGDLSPARLLLAYALGIFPWYDEQSMILWWSPDPRCVLYTQEFHLPTSLKRKIKAKTFELRIDTAFNQVVAHCAVSPRPGQEGTWIVPAMREAYGKLHQLGFAHSIEVWADNRLCGGIYGVSLGKAFFGESMFYLVPDASKIAMYWLMELMKELDFKFLDCQQKSENVTRFGAREIPRQQFIAELNIALESETLRGSWQEKAALLVKD